MTDTVLVVDTNAIRNLWAGGGPAMWDQLLKGADHLVISKVVLDELDAIEGIPVTRPGHPLNGQRDPHTGMGQWLRDWMQQKGIQVVDFDMGVQKVPRVLDNRLVYPKDTGENVAAALIDRANNADADAALRAAGIPTNGSFRFLTDDSGALDNIAKRAGSNNGNFPDSIAALGHGETPYYGTPEFLAERRAKGDLVKAKLDEWTTKFKTFPDRL
jgi:hypothetical protein